jgi:hypothetical protein
MITAFDRWTKKRDRKSREYRAAEREVGAAQDRSCRLLEKIADTPALTWAGLIGKAQLVKPGMPQYLSDSVARDVLALGKGAAAA